MATTDMVCPACNKPLELHGHVLGYCENYVRGARARALCCGALVTVSPVVQFSVRKVHDDTANEKDDWGN